jgi:hypothetical protein
MKDLFGAEILAGKAKQGHPRGYRAAPGSGPAGQTCKTCTAAYRRQGGSKAFWKCSLVNATAGPGTDIRLKSPACRFWAAA